MLKKVHFLLYGDANKLFKKKIIVTFSLLNIFRDYRYHKLYCNQNSKISFLQFPKYHKHQHMFH